MEFRKAVPVNLRTHPILNEKWLQGLLAEDPSLLGLGDLVVKDVERRQPRAGRLDLLLHDPETLTRYEVELQLGATDEAHIIRTIEYWDIERKRYPQYEHVAVIVAEDITSRFLNVISLFNAAIPLIAIQMRVLDVGGVLTLNATTVLSQARLGTDEEDEPGQATDRAYWINRGSQSSVTLADTILGLVNGVTPGMSLKYNRHYIGLAREGIADNFVQVRPRREHAIVEFRMPRNDTVSELLDASGLDVLAYNARWGRYRIRLTEADLPANRNLLVDLIRRAAGTPAPVDE
ncbi:hypothetical protein [Micromonospora profundi]|uniref:hypothetical protein n=1 Tax=Micromonospora profundi TaxID=1420889 RepID=UPI0036C50C01